MALLLLINLHFLLLQTATAQNVGDVRLMDGTDNPTPSGGRLEAYYFQSDISLPPVWGTVCSTGFDYQDGDVVCRQLGFQSSHRVGTVHELGFPEASSSTLTLVDDVNCFSYATKFFSCGLTSSMSCANHSQDVAVNCTNDPDPVRLVSQSGRTNGTDTGRLEIFINGEWGTVCSFSPLKKSEADIACRQLGFSMGSISSTIVDDFEFSWTTDAIWLGQLDCTSASSNANLRTCLHGGRNEISSFCTHRDDVILSCLNEGSLRLVTNFGTYTNFSSLGRLEVYSGGRWGTVCGNGFTITAANVACNQLGFSSASNWGNIDNSDFLPGAPSSTEILLDGVNCTNDDVTLLSCGHKGIGVHSCTHAQDVGLTCQARTPTPPYQSDPIRLVSQTGRTTDLTAGRVEVFLNNRWGIVCDSYFGITEASVLCRQLGFPSGAISFSTAGQLGVSPSLGRTWLQDLNCYPSPSGSNWRACSYAQIETTSCSYGQEVILSCLREGSVRLLNGSFNPSANFSSYGRLEVYSGGRWGTVCNGGFTQTNADVVCRQLGFTGADRWSNISSVRRAPSSRLILLDDVSCSSSDQTLLSCRHSEIGVHDCSHDQDVEVYCTTRIITTFGTPTTATPTTATSTTATSSKVGAIAGGVVGGAVFIVCVVIVVTVLLAIYFRRGWRGKLTILLDLARGDDSKQIIDEDDNDP